jgi:hypothetical protein
VGAIVMLLGCLLPWYSFGGDLPGRPLAAWDGSGALVLGAALAVIALLLLPWAAGPDGRRFVDRWLIWALVAGVAVTGLIVWPLGFLDRPGGLTPDRAPGLWIAVLGAGVLAFATWTIAREPHRA